MTAPTAAAFPSDSAGSRSLDAAIAGACDRIAPTWPLDRFIAVNPYWGWRGSTAADAAAMLATLAGTSLTMPRSWFRDEWSAGRLDDEQLDAAAATFGDPALAARARNVLRGADDGVEDGHLRLALVTDVRDRAAGPRPGQTWTELVVHQIGQHCAAHVDRWQGSWHPDRSIGLFTGWRNGRVASHGIAWHGGASWARAQLDRLPDEPVAAVALLLDELRLPLDAHEDYLTALLLSVNGWAAWFAYQRFEARLLQDDNDEIVSLLAIRLAWEWLLSNDDAGRAPGAEMTARWRAWAETWTEARELAAATAGQQRVDWALQLALERTYQQSLITALPRAAAAPPDLPHVQDVPDVQAVFCIDVRSEVFRRALESVTPTLRTRGFAGFFGLPIAYTPAGTALTRPQLPGLLTPVHTVSDGGSAGSDGASAGSDGASAGSLVNRRTDGLERRDRWGRFRRSPSSMFSFVESLGLPYGAKLVKHSLPHTHAPQAWEQTGLRPTDAAGLRPRLALVDDDPAAAAAIGHRVLHAMGLIDGFASVVLLCGHGSQTENNPHGAGLDCGACGGQTGEVNARVLADLLNAPDVRAHLAALGTTIPTTTWFVPGLHNTTTDQVQLFDTDLAPAAHRSQVARLEQWLDVAGEHARAERAGSLGLGQLVDQPARLKRTVLERANDWSQVRPEWGLAGNAAFVVAPRSRTRGLDLRGRCFLHDYDWRLDPDCSVLTLIMTAPMVVTNWINLQYHASTVDNGRYGSGNKVLHNVVGGNIGVFEGNGGDLRIGLSVQSLHDGTTLRHPPLRLSVFIEATRHGIDAVIDDHQVVRDLVGNGWLHLLRIDPDTGTVERWTPDGWATP